MGALAIIGNIFAGIGGILGKILNGGLDLLGKIPSQVYEWAIALAFIAGIGWWGCRTFYDIPQLQADHTYAVQARADEKGRDKAEAARQETDKQRLQGRIDELKRQMVAERAASDLAQKNVSAQLARARGDNKALLAQLDTEKVHVETTANYCGSALARVLYDHAAGADLGPGGISTPEAEAAGTPDGAAGAAAKAPPVSCVQLGQGYAALAEWGRATWSKLTQLQQWAATASAD